MFQVIFTHGEDSQVGYNNFNWSSEVSSVQLVKLPQKNFKSRTESGEKFNLKKFTQVNMRLTNYEGFQLYISLLGFAVHPHQIRADPRHAPGTVRLTL